MVSLIPSSSSDYYVDHGQQRSIAYSAANMGLGLVNTTVDLAGEGIVLAVGAVASRAASVYSLKDATIDEKITKTVGWFSGMNNFSQGLKTFQKKPTERTQTPEGKSKVSSMEERSICERSGAMLAHFGKGAAKLMYFGGTVSKMLSLTPVNAVHNACHQFPDVVHGAVKTVFSAAGKVAYSVISQAASNPKAAMSLAAAGLALYVISDGLVRLADAKNCTDKINAIACTAIGAGLAVAVPVISQYAS